MATIDLDLINISENATKTLSKEICQKNFIFPFDESESYLFIAAEKDLSKNEEKDIGFLAKKNIKYFICKRKQILKYISRFYEEDFRRNEASKVHECEAAVNLDEDIASESPASKIVDSIIKEGIYKGASDIHIEPREKYVVVRYRIDGALKTFSRLPIGVYSSMISRIKVLGRMDIGQKYIPQDGEISMNLQDEDYDFRVSTLPTIHGEKCVLRVLKRNNSLQKLENIGLESRDFFTVKNILRFKQGIILIVGATGSGKTTTLYSMLNEINSDSKNIITIEKPVECDLKGINQVAIGTVGNNSYDDIIKTVLRQDPDVIMIGEILEKTTAEVAINASLTGHLVLTTLHTNDASSTIGRLKNMGISPDRLKDSLLLIISQRLTRCICPDCKEEYELTQGERAFINDESMKTAFRGKGCGKCNYTGYRGRRIVYEMMTMSDGVKKLVMTGDSDEIREAAVSEGMVTIDDYFKKLIREGVTTISEYYSNMEIYNVKKAIGVDYGI